MTAPQGTLLNNLDRLLSDIVQQKTASISIAPAKKADGGSAHTEPGGYEGPTTHPSKDVDDRTETASEGARSAENEKDVKADQGSVGVDSTPDATPGAKVQDSSQMDVGITSKETGEDPSAETESAKGGKDDPGSSHPARTDNNSLDGMKYASIGELRSWAKRAQTLGNDLVALIAVDADNASKTAGKPAAPAAAPATAASKTAATPAAAPATEAAQTGFDLAGLFANPEDKQACDQAVVGSLAETIFEAETLATKLAQFVGSWASKKADAADGDGDADDKGGKGGGDQRSYPHDHDASGGGDAGGAGGGGGDDAGLMQMLAGGQSMGGADAMAGMGGMGDPGAGGGDPAAAAGGGAAGPGMDAAPGGDPNAGGGPAGPSSPDDLQMLDAVLQQLGITPEELQQALMSQKAGQLANKQAAGQPNWRPKNAGQKKAFENLTAYIKEVVGR